jgi:hypothetical protein
MNLPVNNDWWFGMCIVLVLASKVESGKGFEAIFGGGEDDDASKEESGSSLEKIQAAAGVGQKIQAAAGVGQSVGQKDMKSLIETLANDLATKVTGLLDEQLNNTDQNQRQIKNTQAQLLINQKEIRDNQREIRENQRVIRENQRQQRLLDGLAGPQMNGTIKEMRLECSRVPNSFLYNHNNGRADCIALYGVDASPLSYIAANASCILRGGFLPTVHLVTWFDVFKSLLIGRARGQVNAKAWVGGKECSYITTENKEYYKDGPWTTQKENGNTILTDATKWVSYYICLYS